MEEKEKETEQRSESEQIAKTLPIEMNTSQNVSVQENKIEKENKEKAEKETTRVESGSLQMPKLFLFFVGSLLYLELVFYLGHFGTPDGDYIYSCLFLISLAGILSFLSAFGSRAIRMTVSYVWQVLVSLLYGITGSGQSKFFLPV